MVIQDFSSVFCCLYINYNNLCIINSAAVINSQKLKSYKICWKYFNLTYFLLGISVNF